MNDSHILISFVLHDGYYVPYKPITLSCILFMFIFMAINQNFYEFSKHVEVDCHFILDKVMHNQMSTQYTSTLEKLEYLTKV